MNALQLATIDMFLDKIIHTDLATLCRSMPPKSVDCILSDLPYGTTACSWDSIIPFKDVWEGFTHIIKPRGAIILTASQPFTSSLVMSNPDWFRYDLVWQKNVKTGFLNANRAPLREHESILVFAKDASPYYYPVMRTGSRHHRGGNNEGVGKGEVYRTFKKRHCQRVQTFILPQS